MERLWDEVHAPLLCFRPSWWAMSSFSPGARLGHLGRCRPGPRALESLALITQRGAAVPCLSPPLDCKPLRASPSLWPLCFQSTELSISRHQPCWLHTQDQSGAHSTTCTTGVFRVPQRGLLPPDWWAASEST